MKSYNKTMTNFNQKIVITLPRARSYNKGHLPLIKSTISFSPYHVFLQKSNFPYIFSKRTMMVSPKNPFFAKAIHNSITLFVGDRVLNSISKKNTKPLTDAMVDLSLDHNQGVMQNKTAVARILFGGTTFPSEEVIPYAINKLNLQRIYYEKSQVDVRVFNEIPMIPFLADTYKDRLWFSVTCDTHNYPFKFHSKIQANVDFVIGIQSNQNIPKYIPHDAKAGVDCVSHTTRGYVGLISYDEHNNEIPVTSKTLDLREFNTKRLQRIETQIGKKLDKLMGIHRKYEDVPYYPPEINAQIQQELVKHIQYDSTFDRTVSLVETVKINSRPTSDKEKAFEFYFKSLLEGRSYNLDKIPDRQKVAKAMLQAYYKVEGTKGFDRLQHLSSQVQMDTRFLHVLAATIKENITTVYT